MPRFFVPPEDIRGTRLTLRGAEARHAIKVLRLTLDDEIDCFDGKDTSFRVRIISVQGEDYLEGEILSHQVPGPAPTAQVTLCQGLLKGPKWDWFLEKACEIGVHRVIPLLTQRTVVKASERDARKLERWRKIVLSASKQCGRNDLMMVDEPLPFHESLALKPETIPGLIPWEKEDNATLHGISGHQAWLFIGPEGGWDFQEIELARRRGLKTVKLGPTLLRSETAGLVAALLALREMQVY